MIKISQRFVEDEVTELKKSTSELKEGIISIVSILNKHHGGKLYFGIKNNGDVIGQDISEKTLRDVSKVIVDNIEPKIYPAVTNIKIDDKDCILVEFEGDDTPYLAYGRAYIRVADEDKQLSMKELRKLVIKNEMDNGKWDSLESDKTIDDVNEEVLKDYIKRARDAKRIPFDYTNKKDVLNKLRLLNGDKLLNAGKVLFCDDNRVVLQMAIFATDTKTTFIDIDRKEGNIFDLIKTGQDYIRKNIIWEVEITNKRNEYPEIPLDSIREAITNSYAHKSYLDPKGVEISIFKDRVEIYNPGTFPEEYTPIDYIENKAHSIFRNPLIAEILYKSQDVDSYASGIKRMYDECTKNNVKLDFREEKIGFTIIFYRKDYSYMIGANGTKVGTNIRNSSDVENDIVNLLKEDERITQREISAKLNVPLRTLKRIMNNMQENRLIKRIGSNRSGYWEILK